MTIAQLRSRRVAIVGMGVNNRKLAEYFDRQAVPYEVIEWQNFQDLDRRLLGTEVLFRTPGLPFNSAPIQNAIKRGGVVASQTRLFFELCPCPIVGVTGTKGKGTTSSLLYAMLRQDHRPVWLGGNIGRDPFEFLDQLAADHLVVLELSSFQLQDLTVSPAMAVVINLYPDHLDHHGNFEEYAQAKANILRFQKYSDAAILNPELPGWLTELGAARKIFFDPSRVADWATHLLGSHNWTNLAAAAAAASELGVPEATIRQAAAEFEPLPHRLQVVGTINGVTWVDDSFSTNPVPAMAAIRTFAQPLVLIVGGFDKGLAWDELGQVIRHTPHLRGLVIFGQVTSKLLAAVAGFGGEIRTGAVDMSQIVRQAQAMARPGDAVVFSPGTSSFDLFRNELDRGEQFVAHVKTIQQISHD